MASEMMRHVRCENREISYLLEQKPVKNLNLRIHKDGRVFLSANPDVPASEIDILPSPNSMSVEKPSIFWGVVCA